MTLQMIRRPTHLALFNQGNLLPYSLSVREGSVRNSSLPIMMILTRKFFSSPNGKARNAAIIPSSTIAFSYLKRFFANLANLIQHCLLFFGARLLSALTRTRKSFRSQMSVWSGKSFTAGAAYQLSTSSSWVDSLELHYGK